MNNICVKKAGQNKGWVIAKHSNKDKDCMFCIITYVIKGVSQSSETKEEEGSACGKDGA